MEKLKTIIIMIKELYIDLKLDFICVLKPLYSDKLN